jgi:hypothetical protein
MRSIFIVLKLLRYVLDYFELSYSIGEALEFKDICNKFYLRDLKSRIILELREIFE